MREIYITCLPQSFSGHFRRFERKNFLRRPTMVADNISELVAHSPPSSPHPLHPPEYFSFLRAWWRIGCVNDKRLGHITIWFQNFSFKIAIVIIHFGLHNILLSLIVMHKFSFTFLFLLLPFKFHFINLRHHSWNIKKQRVLLIWNNRGELQFKKNCTDIKLIWYLYNFFEL